MQILAIVIVSVLLGIVIGFVLGAKAAMGTWLIALLLWLSGCVRVRDFNRKQYEQCVEKHGGETWQWNGMPMTCRQLTYPSTICDVNGCVGNGETVKP